MLLALPQDAVSVQPPILEERWRLQRAFAGGSRSDGAPRCWAWSGVWPRSGASYGRRGRDRRYLGSPIDQVMGNPGGDPSPSRRRRRRCGPVGVRAARRDPPRAGRRVLIDEQREHRRVAATIVDLAVRGYLVIEEIPKRGLVRKPDWRLTPASTTHSRRSAVRADAPRRPVPRRSGRDAPVVAAARTLRRRLAKVQHIVRRRRRAADGSRATRPDRRPGAVDRARGSVSGARRRRDRVPHVAGRPLRLARVAVAIVGRTRFLVGARGMPHAPRAGTAMFRRLRGYRTVIDTADQYLARWAEQENVFPTSFRTRLCSA